MFYTVSAILQRCNQQNQILPIKPRSGASNRAATENLSQVRPNILHPNFLTICFLYERIETQNLGKAQALGALPAVALQLECGTVVIKQERHKPTLGVRNPWLSQSDLITM